MNEKFLPIGTICTINDCDKKIMIIGYNCNNFIDGKIKTYDYKGCVYPFGVTLSEERFVFNEPDVEQVIFYGYSDPELSKLIDKILDNESNSIENNLKSEESILEENDQKTSPFIEENKDEYKAENEAISTIDFGDEISISNIDFNSDEKTLNNSLSNGQNLEALTDNLVSTGIGISSGTYQKESIPITNILNGEEDIEILQDDENVNESLINKDLFNFDNLIET